MRTHHRQELEAITQAYLPVHFGETPEKEDRIREVPARWERVRRSMEPIRTSEKGNSR